MITQRGQERKFYSSRIRLFNPRTSRLTLGRLAQLYHSASPFGVSIAVAKSTLLSDDVVLPYAASVDSIDCTTLRNFESTLEKTRSERSRLSKYYQAKTS